MTEASQNPTPLQRAFKALEDTRAKLAAREAAEREPIAIIGFGLRAPGGVHDARSYWDLMMSGIDAVTPVPEDRWEHANYYDPDPDTPGHIATHSGGFLDNVDGFDPGFFRVAPREAEGMDPQQRLMLKVVWEALENAGQVPSQIEGSATGVYLGLTGSDYAFLQLKTGDPALLDSHFGSGVAHSVLSGRVSYLFGLQGPSMTIDTACSSSLVAVHLAAQALRSGDCRMAVAGGVNLILAPETYIALSRAHMLAPDGRCKTFSANADGYSRAEGCGAVVLKRLSDAQADGDRIVAVIRGSATNQDGPSGSLTAPNGPAQEALIRSALARAGMTPSEVGYIEAHGTGTELGDPLEVRALGAVFAGEREAPLVIGSVKTNIGHTEGAAGVLGLIKAALAVKNAKIPPHLHFEEPSPHIDWEGLGVKVPTSVLEWVGKRPRAAGVSSFGFSGTNAHLIVAEPPAAFAPAGNDERTELMAISARDPEALAALAHSYAETIEADSSISVSDACRTANAGRSHYAYRTTIRAGSREELIAGLRAIAAGEPGTPISRANGRDAPRIAFLFTGQGAQFAGMGRDLYASEPVFCEAIDRCDTILDDRLGARLTALLFEGAGDLDATANTQPALFALEYALAKLWQHWGITPNVVIGHSIGEYVAACLAGVFSLEDALTLVAKRGELMQSLPAGGGMAAIFATESEVQEAIADEPELSVAAINGPVQAVIAGPVDTLQRVCAAAEARDVKTRMLPVSHAFHSALVEPVTEAFEQVAASVQLHRPRMRLISNLTGQVADPAEITKPAYWRRHIREAVRFNDGLAAVAEAKPDICIEVGPQPALLAFAAATLGNEGPAMLASMRKGPDQREQMLDALAAAYRAGAKVDWRAVSNSGQIVNLPSYPFTEQRYWFRADPAAARISTQAAGAHPLLGQRQRMPEGGTQFLAELSLEGQPWIADHVILGTAIMPGAGFIDTILGALDATNVSDPLRLSTISIGNQMRFQPGGVVLQHTQVETTKGAPSSIVLRSTPGEDTGQGWTEHARAMISATATSSVENHCPSADIAASLCTSTKAVNELYDLLDSYGAAFGPQMRMVKDLRFGDEHSWGVVEAPKPASQHALHPTLLDGAIQLAILLIDQHLTADGGEPSLYLPLGMDSIELFRTGSTKVAVVVTLLDHDKSAGYFRTDMRIETPEGELVALVNGVHFQRVNREAMEREMAAVGMTEHRMAKRFLPIDDLEKKERTYLVVADSDHSEALADVLGGTVVQRDDLPYALDGANGEMLVVDIASPAQAAELGEATRKIYGRTLETAKTVLKHSPTAGYCLVTRGAQAAAAGEAGLPEQETAIGLLRSIAGERADRAMLRLDLDPSVPFDARSAALALRGIGPAEPEIAIRSGANLAPRLQEQAETGLAKDERLYFTARERGDLDVIHIERQQRVAPGEGQVEIAVRAAGLNFRDVLSVIGMKASEAPNIGSESAGIVTRVGAGVEGLKPGDRVVAVDYEAFATHVTVGAALVLPLPETISFAEAVTLPNTYLTAWLAFQQVQNFGPGMTVLIHAAAGGVGAAATRVASLMGATVIGTASTPQKRAFAEARGATHVFDSRSDSFRDDVLRVTKGEGVDFVLNSLTGDLIVAGMAAMKDGGTFVEIGKNDIWAPERVAAEAPNIDYRVIDLGTEINRDSSYIREPFADILQKVADGELDALPIHAFPLAEAKAAFRYMANGRHIGKVVLVPPMTAEATAIRPDGTYLVTGGLGGVGLAAAEWLVSRGAGAVVLVGRSAPKDEQLAKIELLRANGGRIETFAGDTAKPEALIRLRSEVLDSLPPLRGVLHAAGSLADATLDEQDVARFEVPARAKVDGTIALDTFIAHDPIDFFVSFSSISSVFGGAGQANYAGANAFLNGHAAWRRANGRPGLAVAWGPWAEAGMAANLGDEAVARWERGGMGMIAPDAAFRQLELALASDDTAPIILRMNRPLFEQHSPAGLRALFGAAPSNAVDDNPDSAVNVMELLRERPEDERLEIVRQFVLEEIARVLGFNPAALDVEAPLSSLGFDSLMAVMVRNSVTTQLGVDVALKNLLASPTIVQLSEEILKRLYLTETEEGNEGTQWEGGTL